MEQKSMSTNEIKDTLQLYESLTRLSLLSKKIDTNKIINIKSKVNSAKNESDLNKRIAILEESFKNVTEIQEEYERIMKTYNETVIKILNIYERIIVSK